MGGDLYCFKSSKERPSYTRIDIQLENGWRLAFTCPRNICRVMLVDDPMEIDALRTMGPEPLERGFSSAYLKRVLSGSPSRLIKPLLMDQSKIAGVGNIYADQILFEARVLPYRKVETLTNEEVSRIARATRKVLREAITTAGEPEFPADFLMSLREAKGRCHRCGGLIERLKIAGRTAHYCPHCQR
jgi:formamidopyrimidine-DNA glycosylase